MYTNNIDIEQFIFHNNQFGFLSPFLPFLDTSLFVYPLLIPLPSISWCKPTTSDPPKG